MFTKRDDRKFRGPGLNTSFWEAAIVGAIPQTASHAVLSDQWPDSTMVGGTVLLVNAAWLAKIRSSNILGDRIFQVPDNDFPFPNRKVNAEFLTSKEERLAFANKMIPAFRLTSLHVGRRPRRHPTTSFFTTPLPEFPLLSGRAGARRTGTFQQKYLSRATLKDIRDLESLTAIGNTTPITPVPSDSILIDIDPASYDDDRDLMVEYMAEGWYLINSQPVRSHTAAPKGRDSALTAFTAAMKAIGSLVTLEDVKQVAIEQGYDDQRTADFREIARLSKFYGVETVLESGALGWFRIPSPGSGRIHLVDVGEGHFGWVGSRQE
jgi:hypothetical protein